MLDWRPNPRAAMTSVEPLVHIKAPSAQPKPVASHQQTKEIFGSDTEDSECEDSECEDTESEKSDSDSDDETSKGKTSAEVTNKLNGM